MPPTAIAFNPLLFEVQQDPYRYYAQLREVSPVYYIESLNAWGVFRYDDVVYTLKHPELFSARDTSTLYELFENPVALAMVRAGLSRVADAVDASIPKT